MKHVRHPDIDKQWWDRQLLRCSNRMWYAQSWVLDLTSPGWEALVDERSGAIMPLTWRSKFIFKYLFQPYGSQQLGVFAMQYANDLGEAFIKSIPDEFRLWDIALNEAMEPFEMDGASCTPLAQQVLLLDRPIAGMREGYSAGHRRNLRKAEGGPPISTDINAGEFTQLFVRTTARRFKSGTATDHATLEQVIARAIQLGQCTILGIRKGGELCAAGCFMEWEGRSIFYKSALADGALELKGMFRVTDAYIERNTGSGLLLDFAGSNTPSVARFNSGFGAQGRIYLHLKRNDLPPPFKWFKQ